MLVLARRVGQTVTIGQDIKVMVLGINGNQVRLGVEAPKDIAVHRDEIYQRINRELEAGQGARQFPLHNEDAATPVLERVPTITEEFAPWSASKILHPRKSPSHFQRRRRNT